MLSTGVVTEYKMTGGGVERSFLNLVHLSMQACQAFKCGVCGTCLHIFGEFCNFLTNVYESTV